MEVLYCALAFTGFASFFTKGLVKAAIGAVQLSCSCCSWALKFLLATTIPKTTQIEERIEGSLNPRLGFLDWVRAGDGQSRGFPLLDHPCRKFHFPRLGSPPMAKGKLACISGVAVGNRSLVSWG